MMSTGDQQDRGTRTWGIVAYLGVLAFGANLACTEAQNDYDDNDDGPPPVMAVAQQPENWDPNDPDPRYDVGMQVDIHADSMLRAQITPVALPAGFYDDLIFDNLDKPIDLAFLPDGRALIASKKGKIYIANFSTFPAVRETWMVIKDVYNFAERGLLGITTDPDFTAHPYVYVFYTSEGAPRVRVTKFRHYEPGPDDDHGSVPGRGDIKSRKVIWSENEGYSYCCHYGGSLSFGSDSLLYITTGDKSNATSSQDMLSAAGKVHRVDRNGGIPADNLGLRDGPGKNIDSIWALGLRNPIRATHDPVTGAYLIADVGSNLGSASWEEVNLGTAAANYGWPLCEGPCGAESQYRHSCKCLEEGGGIHTSSVLQYRHNGKGGAVIGGVVYRSNPDSPTR